MIIHLYSFFFIPLYHSVGVEEFLWTTYMKTETTGGPALTYGQQNAVKIHDRTSIKYNEIQKQPVADGV